MKNIPVDEAEWENLTTEIVKLFNAGKYDQAIPLAKKALKAIEDNITSDAADFSKVFDKFYNSYRNLGSLYFRKGDYAKAENVAKCALKLSEKMFGHSNLDTIPAILNLMVLYEKLGCYAQANALEVRKDAINKKDTMEFIEKLEQSRS